MENQKISIEQAAKMLGAILHVGVYTSAESLLKILKEQSHFKIDKSKFGQIHFEMTHFYINLTDRFVFHYLGDPRRHHFFDIFRKEVYKNNWEGHKNTGGKLEEKEFNDIFNEIHKKRQIEYGMYEFSPKNLGSRGNLFFEFNAKLAEILGFKNDSLIIMQIHAIFVPIVNIYFESLKKFLSGISDDKL